MGQEPKPEPLGIFGRARAAQEAVDTVQTSLHVVKGLDEFVHVSPHLGHIYHQYNQTIVEEENGDFAPHRTRLANLAFAPIDDGRLKLAHSFG